MDRVPHAAISVTNLSFGSFVVGRNIAVEQGVYTQTVQISTVDGLPLLTLQGVTSSGANPNDFPIFWENCSAITAQSPYGMERSLKGSHWSDFKPNT